MIYGIIGRRERGKTTLAYAMVRRVAQRVVFDPRHQIDTGAPRITAITHVAPAIDRLLLDPQLSEIVITPIDDVQLVFARVAAVLREWIQDAPDRPLAVLVDEARFVDTNLPAFDYVLRCAPRETCHVVLTCHRPVDLTTHVRAILDHWFLFHCTLRHDLVTIRERCGDGVAARVAQLGAYEFIHWDDGRGIASVHRDPTTWYVALRAGARPPGVHDLSPGGGQFGSETSPIDVGRLFG